MNGCTSAVYRVLLVGDIEHNMASHNKQAACHPQVGDKDRGTTKVIQYQPTKRAESQRHCSERSTSQMNQY